MKLSRIGRISMAFVVSIAMGLGMTACGGGTVGFMWVLGTQFNQISGFKIDNYTGNLTNIVGSPFPASGTNPVSIVVRPGGRYLYIVNRGAGTTAGSVSEFSVGGDGVLTFQASFTTQGSTPLWAQIDSSGGYLYVLDQLAPSTAACPVPGTACGDITVFSIAGDTGRLSLVTNTSVKNSNGTQLTYFPVGLNPTMMRVSGSCLFTLDAGDNTIFPYTTNSGTGQLTLTNNAVSGITTQAAKLTSINAGSSYIYLTDAGATTTSPGGFILPYTVGTNCSLNTLTGGSVPNYPLTSNPSYSFTDNRGRYLYVLNQSSTNTNNANSTVSVYTIDQTNGKLQTITGSPYSVGSGPVCMGEDPTNQWLYTSNNTDSTVTGFRINSNTGELSNLPRGSTFSSAGRSTCLAISGSTT